METAAKVLVVGGMSLLAYAFVTGYLLGRERQQNPVGPKYLILAHMEPLMQGTMMLALTQAGQALLAPGMAGDGVGVAAGGGRLDPGEQGAAELAPGGRRRIPAPATAAGVLGGAYAGADGKRRTRHPDRGSPEGALSAEGRWSGARPGPDSPEFAQELSRGIQDSSLGDIVASD